MRSQGRAAIRRVAAVLLLCWGGAASADLAGYHWQQVAQGIYLHGPDNPLAGPVDGNTVVIVNARDVVVVDTHINPAAARDAIARLRGLTSRPVSWIVNTHWHDDHTNGNQSWKAAWPQARIVSHRATLKALEREWEPMLAQRRQSYAKLTAEDLRARASELADAEPVRAVGLDVYAGYVAALKGELDTLEPVYPDTVFDDELVLDVPGRKVVLRWMGRGNTDGDAVVWLPDDGVLITGDLLVAPVPFAFDSPVTDWVDTLEALRGLNAATIIPGHGPVQRDYGYLVQVEELLRTTLALVQAARESGATLESLPGSVDLSAEQARFAGADPETTFAWKSYYLEPGLKSAWTSLGDDPSAVSKPPQQN